jgi:transcriptional regulator GlxA family with amidase domain
VVLVGFPGVMLVAQSGLLDSCRATTHWAFAKQLASEFPSVTVDPETDDAVTVIAGRCGFGTAETMRRNFVRRMGISPDQYRKSFA